MNGERNINLVKRLSGEVVKWLNGGDDRNKFHTFTLYNMKYYSFLHCFVWIIEFSYNSPLLIINIPNPVIPAKAGIQQLNARKDWIPACAGMTNAELFEKKAMLYSL